MNRNNEYYKELVERWFEAETTEAEEKELKLFLARTEDPAFDEARAALGFLRAASSTTASSTTASSVAAKGFRRMIPALAVAASVAVAFVLGRVSAPVEVVPVANGTCVSYVHGVEVADEDFAVATMENTLYDLFSVSSAPDPRTDLTLIFNANK